MNLVVWQIAVFAFVLMLSGARQTAGAATVTAQSGPVFVEQGNGFLAVVPTTDYEPGSRIFVPQGTTVAVNYGGDCSKNYVGPMLIEVSQQNPCQVSAQQPEPAVQPQSSVSAPSPLHTGAVQPLIIGGLVVAGGVGLALALNGGGSSQPASP